MLQQQQQQNNQDKYSLITISDSCIKTLKMNIHQLDIVINEYLSKTHPKHSNGFIIRIIDEQNINFERRRSYIVSFPKILSINDINKISSVWSEYAMINIYNFDYLNELSLLSIDPINIQKDINTINIQLSGTTINSEVLVRNLTYDIIDQMNKHLIEFYIDQEYPEIDITDSEQLEEFNKKFDDIDIELIYDKYQFVDIYIPIEITTVQQNNQHNNQQNNIVFYLNGTIETKFKHIDIIDDIRKCLDFNDQNELLKYDKEEIIYKFGNNKKNMSFEIITDPDI